MRSQLLKRLPGRYPGSTRPTTQSHGSSLQIRLLRLFFLNTIIAIIVWIIVIIAVDHPDELLQIIAGCFIFGFLRLLRLLLQLLLFV